VKAELRLTASPRPASLGARLLHDVVEPLRRLPQRLHDRRFWHIQLMVFAATVPHYVIETAGFTNPFETFHGLSITLYVIPLLYAAITFGWEGAILTAMWGALLTSPSMWLWHRSSYHWITEIGQLAITLPIGIMVAWRVDLESKQRRRAEQTSASLALLNEIGELLSHKLEVEQELPAVVERLRRGLPVDAVWLCIAPQSPEAARAVIIKARDDDTAAHLSVDAIDRLVAERREPVVLDGRLIAVPLGIDSSIAGSLGVAVPEGSDFVDEHVRVLAAVAHEIRVAVENARLIGQRQESLQTYARQVTQAQEDERLRIARELHDETAQELVHLVRRLERLGEADHADVPRQVEDLLTLARGTLQSVRRFSRDLRPSVLDDLGLVPAIEFAVEETNARLTGGAKLSVTGTPRRLGSPVELALFRIAQEALRNVEKHARATSATVDLRFEQDAVRLDVADDGQGYQAPDNVSDLARLGKLGILGMKERAELVGGSFELHARAGGGCQVTVKLSEPATAAAAPARTAV
jgi:signal transduction histidine kinase